jgi:cold shock CspA family protein
MEYLYRYRGKIVKWCEPTERRGGYGFIRPDDGGMDLFFHVRKVLPEGAYDRVPVGTEVEFDMITVGDGRSRAVNVKLLT